MLLKTIVYFLLFALFCLGNIVVELGGKYDNLKKLENRISEEDVPNYRKELERCSSAIKILFALFIVVASMCSASIVLSWSE